MWPRRTVLLLVVVLCLSGMSRAQASQDDGPWRGDCARSSEVRLRVIPDDGRLTVIGLVFSDDQDIWEWTMRHNGDVSASGRTRARDADRSLRIQRSMIDLPGQDSVVFIARNDETLEVCRRERDV